MDGYNVINKKKLLCNFALFFPTRKKITICFAMSDTDKFFFCQPAKKNTFFLLYLYPKTQTASKQPNLI